MRRLGAKLVSASFGIVGLSVIAIVACSTQSTDYDGPHTTTCSTGPPWGGWGDGAEKPQIGYPVGPSEYTNLPECVPRCGAEQKYGGAGYVTYSLAALPSGACPSEGEHCEMGAGTILACPGVTFACNLNGFECLCADGSWRCYVFSVGSGGCNACFDPTLQDAGHDAGHDAGASDARIDSD